MNPRMLAEKEESDDARVTWEDQQRVNTISKLNTRPRRIEDHVEVLKQEKEALGDLTTELELADEDQAVLYKIDQADLIVQLVQLPSTAEDCKKGMKDHAKFGSVINLSE